MPNVFPLGRLVDDAFLSFSDPQHPIHIAQLGNSTALVTAQLGWGGWEVLWLRWVAQQPRLTTFSGSVSQYAKKNARLSYGFLFTKKLKFSL
jgi:hypothetical protein